VGQSRKKGIMRAFVYDFTSHSFMVEPETKQIVISREEAERFLVSLRSQSDHRFEVVEWTPNKIADRYYPEWKPVV
jgi:hypothetical protein